MRCRWRRDASCLPAPRHLAVGRWDHGTFQPTNLATELDGTQVLSLADTAGRPTPSLKTADNDPSDAADLFTTESYQWQIAARGAGLNAEIGYVAPGQVFELRLLLPTLRYQIETLELQPAELLHGRRLDGNLSIVELKHPLTSAKKATSSCTMRGHRRHHGRAASNT